MLCIETETDTRQYSKTYETPYKWTHIITPVQLTAQVRCDGQFWFDTSFFFLLVVGFVAHTFCKHRWGHHTQQNINNASVLRYLHVREPHLYTLQPISVERHNTSHQPVCVCTYAHTQTTHARIPRAHDHRQHCELVNIPHVITCALASMCAAWTPPASASTTMLAQYFHCCASIWLFNGNHSRCISDIFSDFSHSRTSRYAPANCYCSAGNQLSTCKSIDS